MASTGHKIYPQHQHIGLQVIVFSFSKKECEALALQMAPLDLNDEAEHKLVEGVFWNAVDSLSEDDRRLPQVRAHLTGQAIKCYFVLQLVAFQRFHLKSKGMKTSSTCVLYCAHIALQGLG